MTQPMSAVHQKTSSSRRSKTYLVVDGDLGEVAAGGVDDSLRFPRGAGGIEDEEQVLRFHRLGGAVRALAGRAAGATSGRAPRSSRRTTRRPRRRRAGGPPRTWRMLGHSASASSAIRLSGQHLAPAVAAVGGDQAGGLGVVDPVAQRFGREAAEDDRVHRADAGAGQHGDRRLRDHRQVDRHPVAACRTPRRLRALARAADLAGQVPVGVAPGGRPARPPR